MEGEHGKASHPGHKWNFPHSEGVMGTIKTNAVVDKTMTMVGEGVKKAVLGNKEIISCGLAPTRFLEPTAGRKFF